MIGVGGRASDIMTLHDRIFLYKITLKKRRKDVMIAGLLLLATTLSFALGFLMGRDAHRTPIIIQKCASNGI